MDGYVEQGWAEHSLVVGVEGGDEAAEDGEAGQPGHQAGVGGGLGLDRYYQYLEKVSTTIVNTVSSTQIGMLVK